MTLFRTKINGGVGSLTTDEKDASHTLTLSYPNGLPAGGAIGQYRRGNDAEWMPLPNGPFSFPLNPNETIELKATAGGIDGNNCEMTVNTTTNAVFQFSWLDPNWPSLTIEAKEAPIMGDEIK